MRFSVFVISFLVMAHGIRAQHPVQPPKPLQPVPTEEQLQWHRMEMNAFIHFSINTFTDKEWGYGDESPALFTPTACDPGQWVSVLKEAGFRGIILTAKHHDGFCLWPSEFTEHSVKKSPYRNGQGDVVGELSAACREHGMKQGIYLSPWDRNHALYGSPEYIGYYRSQLTELIRKYGPFFEIWFDGANGGDGYYGGMREKRRIDGRTYYGWPRTRAMVQEINPGVIFFSDAGPGCRWVGNESGVAGETNWNTLTIDTLYAGQPGLSELLGTGDENGTSWVPAECDVSIRPGWFWHASQDSLVKTPEELFEIYLSSVGRGGVLLLNVPPDRRGLLHENDIRSLQGFRKIIEREFSTNLLAGASVSADAVRGEDQRFGAGNLIDNNPETFWCSNDNITQATITFDLKEKGSIKYILLQEHITLGQRVKSFRADAWINDQWQEIARGTTIGYKRILRTTPVETARVRIVIENSKACPVLGNVELF